MQVESRLYEPWQVTGARPTYSPNNPLCASDSGICFGQGDEASYLGSSDDLLKKGAEKGASIFRKIVSAAKGFGKTIPSKLMRAARSSDAVDVVRIPGAMNDMVDGWETMEASIEDKSRSSDFEEGALLSIGSVGVLADASASTTAGVQAAIGVAEVAPFVVPTIGAGLALQGLLITREGLLWHRTHQARKHLADPKRVDDSRDRKINRRRSQLKFIINCREGYLKKYFMVPDEAAMRKCARDAYQMILWGNNGREELANHGEKLADELIKSLRTRASKRIKGHKLTIVIGAISLVAAAVLLSNPVGWSLVALAILSGAFALASLGLHVWKSRWAAKPIGLDTEKPQQWFNSDSEGARPGFVQYVNLPEWQKQLVWAAHFEELRNRLFEEILSKRDESASAESRYHRLPTKDEYEKAFKQAHDIVENKSRGLDIGRSPEELSTSSVKSLLTSSGTISQ